MKRLAGFIRSVLPADPFQLCFLCGSVLLFICMQLRCFPRILDPKPDVNDFLRGSYEDTIVKIRLSWLMFSFLARLPLFFAGTAGLFICFWPGKHPARSIFTFICVPVIGGITALCVRFLYLSPDLTSPPGSVLERGHHSQASAIRMLWDMGPALHIGFLGLALVLVFVSRLAMGVASLPLSVAKPAGPTVSQKNGWKRIEVLVWLSISLVGVFMLIAWNLVGVIYRLLPAFLDYHFLPDSASLTSALGTAMLAGMAAWADGENRWTNLRRFTRLPDVSFGMLGVVIPISVNWASNIVAYLKDRIHWAGFEYGKFGPPLLRTYFQFPQALFFWYLPAAVFEEIIWRGYLQPRFVRRFGILQGIFLLGLVWGAFHFLGDFQNTSEDYQVFFKLAFRLFSCVVLGYVFGWLTLRSGSIWPAALAHGFHNVWALSSSQWLREQDSSWVKIIPWACWALLAVALFRFWPPTIVEDSSIDGEANAGQPNPITEAAS